MKLEDPCKQTEDLYSDQQLQMRPLLDVMINRSVWEEVTARGEHTVLEASNVIERSEPQTKCCCRKLLFEPHSFCSLEKMPICLEKYMPGPV